MSQEFEAKFLDINVLEMRKKLKHIGAKIDHENKRYIRSAFLLCDSNLKGYARVRDEGKNVTMTVKLFKDKNFPEEYEVMIKENFETGRNFLKALGIKEKAFQETYREKWKHPLAHEITFDTVPGLPTYMEIDCSNEKNLNTLISKLNLDKKKMRYGAFDRTYEEYYGISRTDINENTPSLTFKNIGKEIKPTKNKKLFEKMVKFHKSLGEKLEKNKNKKSQKKNKKK